MIDTRTTHITKEQIRKIDDTRYFLFFINNDIKNINTVEAPKTAITNSPPDHANVAPISTIPAQIE